jgi:hypothetical protein
LLSLGLILIKLYHVVSDPVNEAAEMLTQLTGDTDEGKGCVITEMLAPFLIKGNAVIPHLINIVIHLFALIKPCVENGDAEHNEELVL